MYTIFINENNAHVLKQLDLGYFFTEDEADLMAQCYEDFP